MRQFLVVALRSYKRFLSPLLPTACRFHPTCSEYMREAVEVHGAARGVWMGLCRLARCQPFCEGGIDPVPPACSHNHRGATHEQHDAPSITPNV